jgi:hypothetical protein
MTRRGAEKVARTGTWRLVAGKRMPGDLDGQIAELLAGLSDDLSIWADLTARFEADVFCGLFMRGGNEGLCLSAKTLQDLGSRNLPLNLDIYDAGTRD